MAKLTNFNTALYIMRLKAGSKYDGLLKIGISNNIERRAKEIGNVAIEYQGDYSAPRAIVMATEMLAQAYAYRKVGRPNNYRQALPVRSGSSEFFNTDNKRQALGFISAARTQVNLMLKEYDIKQSVMDIIAYVKDIFKAMNKRLPKSFAMEVTRIKQTLAQEAGA